MHGGKAYNARFGVRGRGEGVYAETIDKLFTSTAKRLGLISDETETYASSPSFRRPGRAGQMGFGF
jgi:hypothetical protein